MRADDVRDTNRLLFTIVQYGNCEGNNRHNSLIYITPVLYYTVYTVQAQVLYYVYIVAVSSYGFVRLLTVPFVCDGKKQSEQPVRIMVDSCLVTIKNKSVFPYCCRTVK